MTNYTLSASAGSFTLTGYPTPARMYASVGQFLVSGHNATMRRIYAVNADDLVLRLPRLGATLAIVDKNGRPTQSFQTYWQRHCEAIEKAFGNLLNFVFSIQAAYDAAAQANLAASNANNAVTEITADVAAVQELADQIEDGTLNLPSITIGGEKFVNNGAGELVREP